MKSAPSLVRTLLLAPLALALSAAAFAQPAPGNARVLPDANRDGVIDRAEAARLPRLAARFDQLDRNHDGRLDKGERPMHARGKRGGQGRHGIERLDRDHDGRISRAEFDAMRAAYTRQARPGARHHAPSRPAMNFAAIDANRDGYLVRSELRGWHERMRPQREAERRARFDAKFREADLNRDGRLGRVEVDEKMPRLTGRFAWLDENRDGFLSRAELQPHGRR